MERDATTSGGGGGGGGCGAPSGGSGNHAGSTADGVLATAVPVPQRKRRVVKKKTNVTNNPYSPSASSGMILGGLELGLVLSMGILFLYLYGFLESARSLPDVRSPLIGHLGKNLNLARNELVIPDGSEEDASSDVTADSNVDGGGGGGGGGGEPAGSKGLSQKVRNVVTPADKNKNNKTNENKNNKNKNSGKGSSDAKIFIPETKWPVSVRNEDGDFETIVHPGDKRTEMSVPKFWSAAVHHGGLMTRETAMRIGSCITPDEYGNHARGDDCPIDERTIYFAIASYRDFQCRYTVESAFLRAKNPKRIRVGVVDQIVDGEDPACDSPIEPCETNPNQALCLYRDQVDVYEMEAELSVGPVFARHIGHRMYRGEYYVTQSDAHVTYTQNWDADIISQIESLNNEMAVLTTYLTDVQGSIDEQGHSLRKTRPIMCNTGYEGRGADAHLRHGSQPELIPTIKGTPQMQPYWAAGYSFSRGHFTVNVPYDLYQPMVFQGEEMSIGIRGFTIGYDMYAPQRSVCFHHYAVGNNAKIRNKVPHFWEHAKDYSGTGKIAMKRLLGIVHMNPDVDPSEWDHTEEEKYGLGGVRTPEKFYETFGIHVAERRAERHLCRFVDWNGKMHNQFTIHLRQDGMGVDYSKITYRFKDPAPDEP